MKKKNENAIRMNNNFDIKIQVYYENEKANANA